MKEVNPLTIKQGSLISVREPFKTGRLNAQTGQMFWVCCEVYSRANRGHILLARSGQNSATAKAYSFEDATRYFAPVSTFED